MFGSTLGGGSGSPGSIGGRTSGGGSTPGSIGGSSLEVAVHLVSVEPLQVVFQEVIFREGAALVLVLVSLLAL